MLVSVCFTVTLTVLFADSPPASTFVTLNPYEPTLLKVAIVALAALLPLAEKVGAAAPDGSVVTDHV